MNGRTVPFDLSDHHRTSSQRGVIGCSCGLIITAWRQGADKSAAEMAKADGLAERAWRQHTGRPDIQDGCCGCPPCQGDTLDALLDGAR